MTYISRYCSFKAKALIAINFSSSRDYDDVKRKKTLAKSIRQGQGLHFPIKTDRSRLIICLSIYGVVVVVA